VVSAKAIVLSIAHSSSVQKSPLIGSARLHVESVVVITFQNIFHSKIHQNNIFFIFLKLILTSANQNNLKIPKQY